MTFTILTLLAVLSMPLFCPSSSHFPEVTPSGKVRKVVSQKGGGARVLTIAEGWLFCKDRRTKKKRQRKKEGRKKE